MIAVSGTTGTGFWGNHLSDNGVTFGINGKQKGLLTSHLDLTEELSYSLAQTDYSTSLGYASATCTATANQACGSPPTIKSETWQLKLSGNYHLDKASSILAGYSYQHLKSNDYFFNAYQYPYGFTSGLPTNQQAPNYSQNVVFVAYSYNFR